MAFRPAACCRRRKSQKAYMSASEKYGAAVPRMSPSGLSSARCRRKKASTAAKKKHELKKPKKGSRGRSPASARVEVSEI